MLVGGGQRRCAPVALHHKELIVWQKAHKLTLEVYLATKSFPKEETYGITSQLRRAALSVAANIAEGGARRSRKEFAQFVSLARGSASEVAYLLLVAKDLGYLSNERYLHLSDGYDHVSRMLTRLLKALSHESSIP